ncbi:MAG TPA: metalloregulator ArsR/SmtB family transcription factor [Puia sp.]|jgi:DNA-binding transcriptional ArsR family regulator|nr:metalloregulator ArsR/SmtB family transcription factor [Puia sp.]
MEARRDVFQAIADPTRREIINLIAHQPQNLNAISANFQMTRQAISLHIKILEECGLVEIKQQGRERFCEAKLGKLNEVHDWTEKYKIFWTQSFNSLRSHLEKETKSRKKITTSQKRKKNGKDS